MPTVVIESLINLTGKALDKPNKMTRRFFKRHMCFVLFELLEYPVLLVQSL